MPKMPANHRPQAAGARDHRAGVLARAQAELRNGDPSRALYNTAAWKRLRKFKLARNYCCECERCAKAGRRLIATVVDHRQPHRGDPALFYDLENLQSMSKACHDRKTASQDGGFGNRRKGG